MATETAASDPPSEIQAFYSGKTIFLTGTTGFLGKIMLEKLLRTCKDIKHVYIMLREKKGKLPSDRIKEMVEAPMFNVIKAEQPEFLSKVSVLEGDLELPNLGLSDASQEIIKEEVDCIFSVGATVRFDETLRKAAYINVRSTRDLLRIAREMKHLESFVYVSTAFSHCTRTSIDEEFYEPILGGHKFLELVECLDDNTLARIQPILIGGLPNTYVFSKAASEELIRMESKNLPVAIIRPSIVIGTYKEPLPGWNDSIYGATSIFFGIALGLIHTLIMGLKYAAEVVPADFVINAAIAASYSVAHRKHKLIANAASGNDAVKPTIYNYVSRPQNPLTWGEYVHLSEINARKVPSPLIVWHSSCVLHPSYYLHKILLFLCHTIPAYTVDFFARCLGKDPVFVKLYTKLNKFCEVLSFFTTREWTFSNSNVQTLWNGLNSTDKRLFNFDMASFTWDDFFKVYIVGSRLYILKDPLETIPQGRRKMTLLRIVIGTYQEPLPGWIDSIYGASSLFLGIALGLIRTLMLGLKYVADVVPADLVINAAIAASYSVAHQKHKLIANAASENDETKPIIYNYVSRPQNPLTWGEYVHLSEINARKVPSPLIVWHSSCVLHPSYYLHKILLFLCHTIPAYIVDFFARCLGKDPVFVKLYKKINKLCEVSVFFTTKEWTFSNSNVQTLWNGLNSTDKRLFNFDMASFTWDDFFKVYIVGSRLYILKDPLETIPQGRRKMALVRIGHYILVTVLCLLLYKIVSMLWNILF